MAVTTGTKRRAKLQLNLHQHTITQRFHRPDALHVAQPTVSITKREKYHIPFRGLGLAPVSLATMAPDRPRRGLPCYLMRINLVQLLAAVKHNT